MGNYLITFALGPVQSLIASARRTRDLWSGSWILAECTKAAALALHRKKNICLIFPSPENPEIDNPEINLAPTELSPIRYQSSNSGTDASNDHDEEIEANAIYKDANIANVIRAIWRIDDRSTTNDSSATDDSSTTNDIAIIREALNCAKNAANERLKQLCENSRTHPALKKLKIHDNLWENQINDVLECFSAWVRFDDSDPDSYSKANARLTALLNARKNTNDFNPGAITPDDSNAAGIPKSSLDGARESIINLTRNWSFDKAIPLA